MAMFHARLSDMRADRLVAALLVLQARGRVTAAELADELEVSVRTARRDLEALAMAGIPVYSRAGRGGGWSLVGGARTDLTGLTASEARTLFLLAGSSASWAPEVRAVLRKLVQALPATFREGAAAAAEATAVDPSGWGERSLAQPTHLDVLQDAVIDRVEVLLSYVDRDGRPSQRAVAPLGLVDKDGRWYLVADTEAGRRTFRVDRVREVEVTGAPVARPDGFDLGAVWRDVVESVERHRTAMRATVRVHRSHLPTLRMQFGRDLEVGQPLVDDRVEVMVGAAAPEMIAWQLAGWGDRIHVASPPEVRHHLARIARELAAQYAATS